MTLISAIITDAYRESNAIAIGASPSEPQQTEGFSRLKSMIAGVLGFDAGERLADWMVGYANQHDPAMEWSAQDWAYPISNSRILLNHNTTQTLYLPERPVSGARIQIVDVNGALATYPVTIEGNGRLIDGATSVTLSTAGANRMWVYNDEYVDWREITALEVTDEMPFPEQFDDYFIIKLASRLNPRYGRALSDLSLARLQEVTEQLLARYRQTRPMPAPRGVRNLKGPSSRGYAGSGRGGRFGWM